MGTCVSAAVPAVGFEPLSTLGPFLRAEICGSPECGLLYRLSLLSRRFWGPANPGAPFSPLSSTFGSSGDSVIGQLFSCEVENCSMCRCGKETVRVSSTLLFTLSYPESAGNRRGGRACRFHPAAFPLGRAAEREGL